MIASLAEIHVESLSYVWSICKIELSGFNRKCADDKWTGQKSADKMYNEKLDDGRRSRSIKIASTTISNRSQFCI